MSSHMDGEFIEVPKFIPSAQNFTNQLASTCVCDPPKVWNELPDDICSAPSLLSFWEKLKAYIVSNGYLQCVHHFLSVSLVWTSPTFRTLDYELFGLFLFWLLHLRVRLLMQIKRYKSHIGNLEIRNNIQNTKSITSFRKSSKLTCLQNPICHSNPLSSFLTLLLIDLQLF